MMTLRAALIAISMATAPLLAFAQTTLPPSTQDRQQIQNLQYQANLPGTSMADRAQIQRQITQLQYQINTRPAIEPMPIQTPAWNTNALSMGTLPQLSSNPVYAPVTPTIYGSCDADHAVMTYLDQQSQSASATRQERNYIANQKSEIQKDLKSKGC